MTLDPRIDPADPQTRDCAIEPTKPAEPSLMELLQRSLSIACADACVAEGNSIDGPVYRATRDAWFAAKKAVEDGR